MESTFVQDFEKSGKFFGMRKTGRVRGEGKTFHTWNELRKFSAGWIISALLALLLISPFSASANSPSDLQLTYLGKEQMLQVTITHKSFVPNSHYIAKVEIQKNSEKPIVYEYKSQPNEATFTYTYKIPLKEGDRVEAKAVCNLFGSRSSTLIVAKPAIK